MILIALSNEQAAQKAYDSTAKVKDENGVFYLISCWHDEPHEKILESAARFYGQKMIEVVSINQIWTKEKQDVLPNDGYSDGGAPYTEDELS